MIYGLIVFLNGQVAQAFQGHSAGQTYEPYPTEAYPTPPYDQQQ